MRGAESSALNSSLGTPFALIKIFGNNRLQSSFIPKIFIRHKTSTANTRICDYKKVDSAILRCLVD